MHNLCIIRNIIFIICKHKIIKKSTFRLKDSRSIRRRHTFVHMFSSISVTSTMRDLQGLNWALDSIVSKCGWIDQTISTYPGTNYITVLYSGQARLGWGEIMLKKTFCNILTYPILQHDIITYKFELCLEYTWTTDLEIDAIPTLHLGNISHLEHVSRSEEETLIQ